VLLGWQLGVKIKEIPVQIDEARAARVGILRRIPKVLSTVKELKRSLNRFAACREEQVPLGLDGTDLSGASSRKK